VFTCKPASHTLIQEYITGVDLPTHSVRVKRGREWAAPRYWAWVGTALRWQPEVELSGDQVDHGYEIAF